MSYAGSVGARKRWAKPGAREAHSERMVEAMRSVAPKPFQKPQKYGKRVGVTIYIDPATYEAVAKMAQRQRKSGAELLRTYIEWGLETDEGAK